MAEQKSKLLTTITFNENSDELDRTPGFDTQDMLEKSQIRSQSQNEEEDSNTIEGQSEDEFKLNIKPYGQNSPKEENKLNGLNDSELGLRDEHNRSDIWVRQLRAGSFASHQAFGGYYSDSNHNDSLNDDYIYLNNPREKVAKPTQFRPADEGRMQAKLSCITDAHNNTVDIEANHDQPLNQTKPKFLTSDKEIAEYFETPNRMMRVTSIEVDSKNAPPSQVQKSTEESKGESGDSAEQKEREEIIELRKKFLEQKKKERKNKIKEDTLYKYNRDDMIAKVSKIIHKHIMYAEENIRRPSQGAMLFDEKIYKRERWMVHTTHGFSSTMPIFLYSLQKIEYEAKMCSPEDIMKFIKRIFVDLQLAIECILIMLIYIERLMTIGGVEVRLMNWKPLVFMGILLASKFWEDLNFWNVDFLGVGQHYSLEGINQMENEFLALCHYNLFVSASLYARYYFAVRDKFNKKLVSMDLVISLIFIRSTSI